MGSGRGEQTRAGLMRTAAPLTFSGTSVSYVLRDDYTPKPASDALRTLINANALRVAE